MTSRIGFSLVVALICVAGNIHRVEAQAGYSDGYGFGTGFGIGHQFPYPGGGAAHSCHPGFGLWPVGTIGFAPRTEEPPYFAKFPPVYYSHVVRRPYGISPYAAPPGIAPVELAVPAPLPVTVTNPYYNEAIPAATPADEVPAQPMVDETVTSEAATAAAG